MATVVRRDPAKAPRPLTPRSIDALTSGKLFDRGVTPGLHVLVLPSGSKVWRLKYSIGGKERLAALGSWPEVSIDEARLRAGNARKLIDKGMNPTEAERAARTAAADAARYTFGMACAEWLDWVKAQGKSEKTTQKAEWIVKLLRPLHARPVGEITTKELFQLIRRYEEAGKRETAHRMKSVAQRVFDRAAVNGHVETNPARLIGRQLLPVQAQSHAGITDPHQFGMLMRLIDSRGYGSGFTVENALMLLARVFVRPGELRQMRWSEIKDLNGDEPLWIIPAERMKMRRPHVVPLSVQAANIIREQSIISDHSEYVFPGGRSSRRPLSDGALGAALKSLLVSSDVHVPHGFRVTASTLLREIGFESELVELQLAHRTGNAVASIYDRSERLPERRKMMQRWSDYIEECKELKS